MADGLDFANVMSQQGTCISVILNLCAMPHRCSTQNCKEYIRGNLLIAMNLSLEIREQKLQPALSSSESF